MPKPWLLGILATLVCLGTVATAAFAWPSHHAHVRTAYVHHPRETARQFASLFTGLLRVQKILKVGRMNCVSGGGGDFACSYVIRANPRFECHLALVHHNTVTGEVTVRHAGRVRLSINACGPVTRVLRVVGEQ